jgi:hypothetical protein
LRLDRDLEDAAAALIHYRLLIEKIKYSALTSKPSPCAEPQPKDNSRIDISWSIYQNMVGPANKRQKREQYKHEREELAEKKQELPKKKFYRQRAHANPFSDHQLA